jgi:Zn-dependent protease
MSGASDIGFALQPPVLPQERAKPVSPAAFLFKLFLAALLIGVFLESAGPHWLKSIFYAKWASAPLAFITLLLALAASVLAHELGHLLPSLCFGFSVSRIALGPVCATRLHGFWKLQYSRAWFSGSVSAIPPDARSWRARMLTVVAGGPIASLGVFLAATSLLEIVGPAASGVYFLSALAQINLFLFVLGLIPNAADSPIRNDARLFITFLQNGHEAQQIKLYHLTTQLQIAGVRPAAYHSELIARLAGAKGNRDLMLFSALAVFLWAVDSGEVALADVWDRHAIALMEDRRLRLSDSVLSESACFDVLHRNAPADAIEKLKTINFEMLSPWLRHRTRAVLQIAEGAYSDAVTSLRSARASLAPISPYRQFELTILDMLERRTRSVHSHSFLCSTTAA